MNTIIYVSNDKDEQFAQSLFKPFASNPAIQTEVVNLLGIEQDGIPAKVLQAMILKGSGTFPLMFIDDNPVQSGELPTNEQLHLWLVEGVDIPDVLVDRADSNVDFPTASRIHISMDVSNIEQSVAFYKVFFDQEPTKVLDDYAKFEVEEPPLNIALNHFNEPDTGGPVNHFGIQLKSSDAVIRAKERFEKAGFKIEQELDTACCYAVQTKIWVADPDANGWELFVVTEKNSAEGCGPGCICYKELEPNKGICVNDLWTELSGQPA